VRLRFVSGPIRGVRFALVIRRRSSTLCYVPICGPYRVEGNLTSLELQLVPLINLRIEISTYLGLFNSQAFLGQFAHRRGNDPINTPYESWYGRSELFLTRVLRGCILNIESAVCTCVYFEAAYRNILTERLKEGVNNPFSLGGRSTTANVYDKLPGLISEQFKLSIANHDLWEHTKLFYQDVRNPIFHGKELKDADPLQVKDKLALILELFAWLDSWFDMEKLIEGGKLLARIHDYSSVIGQLVVPDQVPPNTPKSTDTIYEIPNVANVSECGSRSIYSLPLRRLRANS
jgi:hypothetical protein